MDIKKENSIADIVMSDQMFGPRELRSGPSFKTLICRFFYLHLLMRQSPYFDLKFEEKIVTVVFLEVCSNDKRKFNEHFQF